MATDPVMQPIAEFGSRRIARPTVLSATRILDLFSRAWIKRLLFLSGDVAGLVASHHLAEVLVQRSMKLPAGFLNPGYYYLFYAPFFAATLYLLEGYKSPDLRRPEKEIELLFKGVSFSFVALACANFVFFKSLGFSRYLLVAWYALAFLFLLAARFSLRAIYDALWRRGFARQRALLLGGPERFADFEQRLAIQRYRGYALSGVLVEPGAPSPSRDAGLALPVLGSIDDWEEIAAAENAQLVVLHLAESSPGGYARALEIVRRCREKGLEVEVDSRLFAPPDLRFDRDEFSGCFRLHTAPRWSRTVQLLAKASLDVVVGVLGSLATLALVPVIWLLIRREDRGPIFHRREYVGMDGCVRHFLKFRTMVEDAEQILASDAELKARFERSFKLKDDPRVLRCGRFLRKYSLDEFPQFFSILAGHLTFVGPRAITPAARERCGDLAAKLLSMKPGLTGFWQVMGRQTTTFEEKIQMDIFYIEHWSIWLDLVILAKTFWEVLRAEGAY
ncbi:MAG TPA: exopolysaccharide biosynthesis polyprenyl glycosylphosphotransferase [Candidatus Acidoferrales bacterium]|nr:exopolysaccharide biosynthesis polyprenyl glycosylphosphotransferase [Candidatus Acidoferrales bacterium]